MKQTFEQFLQAQLIKENPRLLDDQLPDAFDEWKEGISADEFIEFANKWGKKICL